ncbi:hypothetical protein [Bacillus wiedmannii]|uniref:hypothetical protein n=1 Tax=Bacillus wiedmannii TaxID=1890302 RepID=UPI001C01115B|nr:hypothetical protein [Bacillus wiedmannii]MED3395510.1 hypothetical protein [Bacillus wiedmannii]QWI18542.1 hypothetical protein EXW48_22245 [Bacillus wiedmannii]
MPKGFLITFYLTNGQIQQIIYERSQSDFQNKLRKDISNKNINYLSIDGTIIFTKHIKDFDIVEVN